jgi:hypothetical protein
MKRKEKTITEIRKGIYFLKEGGRSNKFLLAVENIQSGIANIADATISRYALESMIAEDEDEKRLNAGFAFGAYLLYFELSPLEERQAISEKYKWLIDLPND